MNVLDKAFDDDNHVKWLEQATGLKRYIEGVTRYSNNNSCIDLLFTNITSNFTVSILDVNISDHQFIHINRIHHSKNKEKLEFIGRLYKNYDYDLFCSNLINLDWNKFHFYNDVNIAWNLLHSRILTTINDMCPLKTFKVAQAKEPWVTNEILEMIKDKDRLLWGAKQRNTEIDWELARNVRNNTNAHIRRAKANFIQDNHLHQNN